MSKMIFNGKEYKIEPYADLRGANLDGANLGGADLRSANLRNANLRNADLDGANLRNANLRNADLDGANLGGANLGGANLYGANLRGANLRGANLDGANLDGADLGLEKAVCTKQPIQILGMFWEVIIFDNAMRIGCQFHLIENWQSFSDEQISKMDRRALNFWNKNKEILLKIAER